MTDELVHELVHELSCLIHELREDRGQREKEFQWQKDHCGLATKTDLQEMEKRIMLTLDDIVTDVQDESTVIDGVVTLLGTLSAQIAAAGTDPVKLQALKDLVDANKAKIASAVIANTPVPPPPTNPAA